MGRLISKFPDDDSGATAIEYCLIAAGIGLVIITASTASAPPSTLLLAR